MDRRLPGPAGSGRTETRIEGWPSAWTPRLGALRIVVVLLVVGAVALIAGITALVLVVHAAGPARSVFGALPGAISPR